MKDILNNLKDLSKQRNSKKSNGGGEIDNDDISSVQSRSGKRRYRRKLWFYFKNRLCANQYICIMGK